MKDKNNSEAKKLFHSAQSYEQAFLILNKISSASPIALYNLFQPVITCILLSLELYFKCLIILEGNEYPHKHEFSLILNKLPSESKKLICEMLYKTNKETAEMIQGSHTHENTTGAFLTEDAFASYLKDHDKDFTDWRYMTLKKGQGINTRTLHTIIEAVSLVIKAKYPTVV